jgi:nucleoside-diphosphate-sugar epimerase
MKIVVTGHNGYIGPLLVRLLIERAYEVKGIDTNYFDQSCEFFPSGQNIEQVVKDIRDVTEQDLEGVDAVCHLAALSNDPVGQLNTELTFDLNYKASVGLAETARKAGVKKFIYSSSCSMYGITGGEALTEEAEQNPVTAYARSKVLTEQNILGLTNASFSVTSLRNATAYGISPKLRVDLVVNNLLGWALTTGTIKIMSDGTPCRPLIHAEDIARAFVAVVEASPDTVRGEAFNVGINSENYQIKDIAALIQKKVPHCKILMTGEHGSDSRTYRVNFDKISRSLPNFKPRWTVQTGIDELLEFYLKYSMTLERFEGRYFIRLKQLQHLIDSGKIDSDSLYWKNQEVLT